MLPPLAQNLDLRHGVLDCYLVLHCRCEGCVSGRHEWQVRARQLLAEGVDLSEPMAWVIQLASVAGLTDWQISTWVRGDHRHVRRIINGTATPIRDHHERIASMRTTTPNPDPALEYRLDKIMLPIAPLDHYLAARPRLRRLMSSEYPSLMRSYLRAKSKERISVALADRVCITALHLDPVMLWGDEFFKGCDLPLSTDLTRITT